MIYLMIREIVNFLFNIRAKYFDKKTSAFDELMEDTRDWAWNIEPIKKPREFIMNDNRFVNQNLKNYTMSCGSQWTCNSINNQLWYKQDKETYRSWFVLFDTLVRLWLASRTLWSYVIDNITTAKKIWYLDWYYSVKTIEEIKNAIYNLNSVVTGSKTIDWSQCKDWLVKSVSSWYGHCFELCGWNDDKIIWDYTWWFYCRNSYWKDFQDNWWFWIPYDLYDKILFNTRKAIIVNPEWSKLSREELFEKYKLRKKWQ